MSQQPNASEAADRAPTPDTDRDDRAASTDGGPAMQGEGNYDAARRHRESAERFVASGQVGQAARDAAPASDAEAERLQAAEREGRSHARD